MVGLILSNIRNEDFQAEEIYLFWQKEMKLDKMCVQFRLHKLKSETVRLLKALSIKIYAEKEKRRVRLVK